MIRCEQWKEHLDRFPTIPAEPSSVLLRRRVAGPAAGALFPGWPHVQHSGYHRWFRYLQGSGQGGSCSLSLGPERFLLAAAHRTPRGGAADQQNNKDILVFITNRSCDCCSPSEKRICRSNVLKRFSQQQLPTAYKFLDYRFDPHFMVRRVQRRWASSKNSLMKKDFDC